MESMMWHDVRISHQHFSIYDKNILIQYFESIMTKEKHFKYNNKYDF